MRGFSYLRANSRLFGAVSLLGLALPATANAQGISQVARNISGNFTDLGNLLLNACLLGGLGFSGAGLMKLKAAADDGGQRVKYSEGLWRLGVGGGLTAVPFITNAMRGTIDAGAGGSSVSNTGGIIIR